MYYDKKSNSYLKFDMSRMVNLEYSLNREILRTNRRGAYHNTTLAECNTRKQHGLLVMPVPALGDSEHVLLSSFDETIIQHGAEFNLGIHKYDGDNYSPNGHKYIREFNCDSLPRTIYRVGGVVLSKEKMFSQENNTIFIKYTLLDAHSPTTIRFKPFLAFREVHSLTQENSEANHGYREEDNGISMCMYTGYPNLYMQFSKDVKFEFEPSWYKGIEYKKDMENGLPFKEDLYVPGYFEMPIKKGESIIFSASDTLADTKILLEIFNKNIENYTPRSSFFNCLKNSAHQFYYRPTPNQLYILDGYPSCKVRARDQFIALPAVTLCIDKPEAFEEAMDTAIPVLNKLFAGEKLTGFLSDLDQGDVLIWVSRSLKKYSEVQHKRFYEKYAWLVEKIVDFIRNGQHPNLFILENGLLAVDKNRGGHPSWMNNPIADGYFTTSRTGYLVETNAFWYNAVMFNRDIAREKQDKQYEEEINTFAEKIKASFQEVFLNEAGYLYDYVDGNYVDWSVRPNMLLAVGVEYPLLDKRQSKTVLDIVTKELYTHTGMRTLSPKSIGFRPRFEGSQADKFYCAYNGAAWPWLLAPYVEAYLRVFQRSGVAFLQRMLIDIEDEMSNDCIGSLSTLYDGSTPYSGHGAVSYATSVAGILRILTIQKTLDNEY